MKRFSINKQVGPTKLQQLEIYKGKMEKVVKDLENSVHSLEKSNIEGRLLKETQLNEQLKEDLRKASKKGIITRLTTEELDKHQANLEISETLSNVKIHQTQAVTQIREQNDCVKFWEVVLTPSVYHPDVKLKVIFQTYTDHDEKACMPSIHRVKFLIDGLGENRELLPAMEYCQSESDIQLFTHLLDQYLDHDESRSRLISKASENAHVSVKDANTLEFLNSEDQILVWLTLKVDFDSNLLDWLPTWNCEFTDVGEDAALGCNIPEEVFETGHNNWTVEYCIETLGKMASLHKPTPRKSIHEEEDSMQVTPLNSQGHRPPKRRLN